MQRLLKSEGILNRKAVDEGVMQKKSYRSKHHTISVLQQAASSLQLKSAESRRKRKERMEEREWQNDERESTSQISVSPCLHVFGIGLLQFV